MQSDILASLTGMFSRLPEYVIYGIGGMSLVLAVFFIVKVYWQFRGNSAHTSYQYGVIAPVQYGDRGAMKAPETSFADRLDKMVESEEAYDLAHLLPKARELGAIAKSTFSTAPVLESVSVGVLALIEEVVQEMNNGYRVLVHTALDSLVDLDEGAGYSVSKRTMTGIDLMFAVVDRYGELVMAVDHMNGAKRERQDFINRSVIIEVLRKAGVWYLEIPINYSEDDARAQIKAVLAGKPARAGIEVA